jgi:tRNA G18 (ribose-2'-O)-methylase SpoU
MFNFVPKSWQNIMRKLSMEELNRVTAEQFRSQPKTPLVLVLENVRSGLNVGSAFRTADSFAVEKIILTGFTATPPHREILKTALGATSSVAWEYESNTQIAIQNLKSQGYRIVAVEQTEGSKYLHEMPFRAEEKVALIFGNEVHGVDENTLQCVETCLEVPQIGTKHSLNIAVCIGIVVWEFFSKWRYRPPD